MHFLFGSTSMFFMCYSYIQVHEGPGRIKWINVLDYICFLWACLPWNNSVCVLYPNCTYIPVEFVWRKHQNTVMFLLNQQNFFFALEIVINMKMWYLSNCDTYYVYAVCRYVTNHTSVVWIIEYECDSVCKI